MTIDTSDEACAVACMLVSNPNGELRKDGDGWQKRVNDLIRSLRDERNKLQSEVETLKKVALVNHNATKEAIITTYEECAVIADTIHYARTYMDKDTGEAIAEDIRVRQRSIVESEPEPA